MTARRLAVVFAEEDQETAARLGEVPVVAYRFQCRHCQSKFSLQQQAEAHEVECGRMGMGNDKPPADQAPKRIACRRCGATFEKIKDLSAHVLEVHAEEHAAAQRAGVAKRQAELRKIDAGIKDQSSAAPRRPGNGNGHTAAARIPASGDATKTKPAEPGGDRRCPLCDGTLPITTARLIADLTRAGIEETQAFEAVRIARHHLGGNAAA